MITIIMGICLSLLTYTVQAVDIHSDKDLEEELAYLHAENYVYSAGKKLQKINDVAAAVFVVSQEDIHRSGATNIPETLRMVPGLQVGQIDANKWAISARGINGRFASKLLVMIDGRSIYTPMFSGVFWNREDVLLEDVDRIEVIRGAGAAMWGANAVNGVINIITKSAKDTHGALLTAGSGNQEQAFASMRYGDKVGDNFDYRVYLKGFKRNNNVTTVNRQNAQDDWENYQGGFKTEWELTKQDVVSTQGDIYHSHSGDRENFALPYPPFTLMNQDSPLQQSGGNIQSRWKHKLSENSETALQVYYKHDDSTWSLVTPFKFHDKTLDVDFQHRFKWLEQHDIIWGLGYRYFGFSSTHENPKLTFAVANRNLQLFSAFLQDDISLLNNQLRLTIGTRLEHNDFTGIEIQPNIRLLWTPNNQQSVWASISRAVRTPSIVDDSVQLRSRTSSPTPGLTALISPKGSSQFKSETVLDYELGYRLQPTPLLSFDISTFYNQYNRLRAIEVLPKQAHLVSTATSSYIEIPGQLTNKMKGKTFGFELTSQWQPFDRLKIQASYWLLKTNLQTPKGLTFTDGEIFNVSAPQQQFHFKSSLNLPYHTEWDVTLRYVDSIPRYQISDYVAFDTRLGWKPIKNIEVSVVGQNLFDNQHPEYNDNIFELPQTQIRRSIFGKVSVSF